MENYNSNKRNYVLEDELELIVGQKMTSVFSWMVIGLIVTTFTGYLTLSNPIFLQFTMKFFYIFLIAELFLVFGFSRKVYSIDVSTSRMIFVLYSALNGITLCSIALIYTGVSIVYSFSIAIVVFLVMAIYGYVTKEDVSKIKNLCMGGLISLIVLSLINLFLKSPALYWMLSYLGVILFTALIAYDVNRIKKQIIHLAQNNDGILDKVAISGALHLYLDFINLFLYILRIFGKKR
ncbi:MAG: Bax inhibitor-1/YccA family protein [Fusobacteriaceae bacterium]